MKGLLRTVLALAAIVAAGAIAQEYPAKPVRIVVPYAPGGGTDTTARLAAARLQAALGQPVVVENRPGASANIGTEVVARAPADGYTVLVTAPNFSTSEALFPNPGWRTEDFAPVIHLVRYANVLVASSASPFATFDELLARTKGAAKPVGYGTPGAASYTHLAVELLKLRTGASLEHVAYKGSGPLKNDLLGGHTPLGADGLGGQMDLIRAGKVKVLAVLAPRRAALAPDLPCLGDFGIADVDGTGWYGALVPAATPAPVVARLNRELAAALAHPEVRDRLVALGVEAVGGSPEEFRAYLLAERRKWAAVIQAASIKAD